jgi:MFS family permease
VSFTSERSRWSDVAIASSAQFCSALGAFLVMVTLVLALQAGGASGVQIAALAVVEALPMTLLGRFIGRVVDRFESRWLLVAAGASQVTACVALSFAGTFDQMIMGAVALSAATAVAQPTRAALIPAMVTREDLPRASAIGQSAGSVGMMLGPALAGLLVGATDVTPTLRVAACFFVATILAGLLLRTRRGGASSASAPGSTPAAWRLSQDRLMQASVWGITVVVGAVSAVNVVFVFFIIDTLESSATIYGLIDSTWMVGLLVGAWLMARLIRPATSDARISGWMFVSLGALSTAVLLAGAAPHALWIVPCYLVGGALNGGENVIAGTLIGRRAPVEARGRASTALASRVQGGALVGFVAGGAALEIAEPRWVIISAGVLGLLIVAAVTPLVRRAAGRGPHTQARPVPSPAGRQLRRRAVTRAL